MHSIDIRILGETGFIPLIYLMVSSLRQISARSGEDSLDFVSVTRIRKTELSGIQKRWLGNTRRSMHREKIVAGGVEA